MMNTDTDFIIQNEGSLYLFRPVTDAAVKFLDGMTTPYNEHLRFGSALAVEHRYAAGFAAELQEEGFTVS